MVATLTIPDYIAIQPARRQTLAAALVDSPIGRLAWIVDTFRA